MKQTVKVLLIDPFQRKIHPLEIQKGINNWYQWCDCECFDHAYLGNHCGLRHDAFVDDNGLLREPTYPLWFWYDRTDPLAGYGLVTACDGGGETIDATMPVEYVEKRVAWELWEARLKAEDYFEQMTRLYLPGGTDVK